MTHYIDLTDGKVFDAVFDTLVEYYGYNEETINFAFDIYGMNEETLENLLYWKWIEEDEFLSYAGIETDDEEDDDD